MRKQKIAGKDVTFYSLSQFAHLLGKKPLTLRRWIKAGIMPPAFFVRNFHSNLAKETKQAYLFSEQEVNAFLAIKDKWRLSHYRNVPKGFKEELQKVWDIIRQEIVEGKQRPIEDEVGFIVRFNNRQEAELTLQKILKKNYTINMSITEISAMLVRELIAIRHS
jgi:hypothetical protein